MLIEQIRKDRIIAFKAKENIKKDVLGCLIADSCKESKEPEDAKVLAIIKKFIDGANETKESLNTVEIIPGSIAAFNLYKADMEIDILSGYRPKQMSEEEIRKTVDEALLCAGNASGKNLGYIMGFFKQNYSSQYDGALVSKIAKEML